MYVDFHDLSPVKAAGPGPSKIVTQHRKPGTSFCLFTLVLSLFPPLLVLPHSFLMVKDSDQQALQTIGQHRHRRVFLRRHQKVERVP